MKPREATPCADPTSAILRRASSDPACVCASLRIGPRPDRTMDRNMMRNRRAIGSSLTLTSKSEDGLGTGNDIFETARHVITTLGLAAIGGAPANHKAAVF